MLTGTYDRFASHRMLLTTDVEHSLRKFSLPSPRGRKIAPWATLCLLCFRKLPSIASVLCSSSHSRAGESTGMTSRPSTTTSARSPWDRESLWSCVGPPLAASAWVSSLVSYCGLTQILLYTDSLSASGGRWLCFVRACRAQARSQEGLCQPSRASASLNSTIAMHKALIFRSLSIETF